MTDMALRDRWVKFYDVNSDVRTMVHVYCSEGLPARPWPYPDNEDERVSWALKKYEHMLKMREIVPDDQVPFLQVFSGTEIFAQAFGCRVHFPEDNMPFALPCVNSVEEAAKIKTPSLSSESLERTFRIARRLRDVYPDAPLGLPDIQSPFDIAALIWNKGDFFPSCIDEPEAVLELCAKVEEVLVKFLDTWFHEFGTDYIAHYPDIFMRGGLTLSEDEAGTIGPEMFRTFCLPALERLSAHFGGIAVHCCADSERQWDNFVKIPGLRLMNINQPNDVLKRAYKKFGPVSAQMHHMRYGGDPYEFNKNAGIPENAHVVLFDGAATVDEAKAKLDAFRSLR